jgi:hypothetical protein
MNKNKENKEKLETIFSLTLGIIQAKLESGEVSASELAVISKLLKDNHIGIDLNVDSLDQLSEGIKKAKCKVTLQDKSVQDFVQ